MAWTIVITAPLTRMKDAGVEIHKYRPLKWYNLGRLNNRSHASCW